MSTPTLAQSWNPRKTRAFIVCLARFEGETTPSFSMDDRLDGAFVELLQARGVPKNQITFLQDAAATTQRVEQEFVASLRASQPDELLLFYYGSHGNYDAETQTYTFASYDDEVNFSWVFEALGAHFKGAAACLIADSCHSGGIVELIPQRAPRLAYLGLSSTHAHNTAWSRWRFVDCLIRGFSGDPRVDLNGDGQIDWADLARYTERHMAFVAEGKPMFGVANGFSPNLCIADVKGSLADPQVGAYVEVEAKGQWYKAEILAVKGAQFYVHYTNYGADSDEWVEHKRVRAFAPPRFWRGARVELQGASSGRWYPGYVLQAWEDMYFCRYDGYGPEYDEWFGASRIRALEKAT